MTDLTREQIVKALCKDVFYGDERLHNLARHNPLHLQAADLIDAQATALAEAQAAHRRVAPCPTCGRNWTKARPCSAPAGMRRSLAWQWKTR